MSENITNPAQPPVPEAPKTPEAPTSVEAPKAAETAEAAKAAAKAAGQDALRASKTLLSDPVGKLAEAAQNLGDQRAMAAGIVFGVVFVLCYVLGQWLVFRHVSAPMANMPSGYSFGGGTAGQVQAPGITFKQILGFTFTGVAMMLGLALGSMVCRKVLGGDGNLRRDLFSSGAVLLPMAGYYLVLGILAGSPTVVQIVGVFAGSFALLMLFAASTDLNKLTRRAASLAVPLTVLTAFVLSYLVGRIFA